jgi:predicted nucleotidyltransferase
MAEPVTETEKRRALARRIVALLAVRTDLSASLLAGSAATGASDEHSDVDLLNYYDVLPEHALFDGLMRELGAEPKGAISAPGPEGFMDRYQLDGVEVQTGAELVAGMDRQLERIAAGEADWADATTAMGLLEGIALHGERIIRRWRERARYPDSLRRREVKGNLGIFRIWAIDNHLAARDAEMFRRQMLLDGAYRVVAILSAVNRLYFSAFQFKRAGAHAHRMAVKPDRLVERLDRVANAPPSEAAEELRTLVEETNAIVRTEMPDMKVDCRWQP